ncbi:MAG TPA: ISL3 family transposase [Ktedonobacteraceae bacterium]|nr:ISL3 family transposase [Ktedonobacteraceae bacterium]
MEGTSLLSLPEGVQIEQIQITENGLVIAVVATSPTSCCPLCSEPSSSIHCHYRRVLRDAPCAGRRVLLFLTVRKFSCRNPYCSRKVFAERFPDFVEPWARMTIRHCQQITSIGLATCGKGGTRLAARLGIQTTRQTILRRIMALPDSSAGVILFLGIDDFSFRRGCRFGTILVNLESHRVVDLLPDREAATSAAWMRQQLDLMAVSRDRGGAYASAAAQGAPQATQCADRFHVLKNLGEAVEDLLARHLSASRQHQVEVALQEPTPAWLPERTARRSHTSEALPSVYQQERMARYQQMIKLREQGMTQNAIAQQIGMSLQTVQRWLSAGAFPQSTRHRYVSQLDPYLPDLFQRWAQGCHTIAQLFRELVAQGYRGSYASVRDNIVRRLQFDGRKTPANTSSKTPALATSRQATFLFLRRPEELRAQEQETVTTLRQLHPEVDLAYDLVQQFARMLRTRTGELLDAWLAQVESSNLPELQSFAAGVEKDKDAVRAGLTWWISNGMVEGHVTKLKLIKRQGYGKAGFPLLRKRVLHAI